jgi:hypothetical protein
MLRVGGMLFEPEVNAKGERLIWLEPQWIGKLTALHGPGERYSDLILRLVEIEAGRRLEPWRKERA